MGLTAEELQELELQSCVPHPVHPESFNDSTILPYGLSTKHIYAAMQEFINFLGFINQQLHTKEILRLEHMLMPANFSSMVGEFMSATIPKYCNSIVKNCYHNGHPDLVPKNHYPNNRILHGTEGIEIKGSRGLRGWQGHNPEDTWLMVFVFDSNKQGEKEGSLPKPFQFIKVVGARIIKDDWQYAGRKGESRRTPTASIKPSGYEKMMSNWIYIDECDYNANNTASFLFS